MKISIFKSLKFKIIFLFVVLVVVLVAMVYFFMHLGVKNLEENLIGNRLEADINYIEDLIGDGEWNVKDGAIYLGDTLVGDGTEENANLAPFLEHEEKTGTFSYVFIKCSDEGLTYLPDTDTQEGYQEGHFLRVAGSTKNPNGESIVGTYISKEVADELDENGTYAGEANVAGGRIYCLYNVLCDAEGTVIGAVVVGRSVSELTSQIDGVSRSILTSVVITAIILLAVIDIIISGWTRSLQNIGRQMNDIEIGNLPEEKIKVTTRDEVGILAMRMNSLVESLKENEALRIKAETDALTGIANRFGLTRFSGETFEYCYHNSKTFAVGFIDIDYFKPYNDNYGHQAGDECIKMIAEILKDLRKRKDMFCARFGGDEFMLILNGYTKDELIQIARELKENVEKKEVEHLFSPTADHVTISQGYSFGTPHSRQTIDDYIHIADDALYRVKESGKNSYTIKNFIEGSIVRD